LDFVWIALITVTILQLSVLYTTIYLHRSLTHRAVQLHPIIVNVMHLHLTLFTGLVPREWAAVHRKHHHFSDHEGDPHSPKVFGMWKVLFGNYFYYRRETKNPGTVNKYTPDYQPDLIDRVFPFPAFGVFMGLGIFMLMFGWAWGLAAWAFHVVGYVLLNSMINSLCHEIGYRNYDNGATNLQFVALLTGGEGLHNNHHEFPTSARFSMTRGEFDPAWLVIRVLEKLGLASVNTVSLARKAA
jgi:stearoyl-CoA desaturase (Delta-9 desaturase)